MYKDWHPGRVLTRKVFTPPQSTAAIQKKEWIWKKENPFNWYFSFECTALALLSSEVTFHMDSLPIYDIWTLFHHLAALSGSPGVGHCSDPCMHVWVGTWVEIFRGKAVWHFWLVKLNMWQPSSKADPCPSAAKLAFKSTNAHLQLLLLRDHLLSHTRAGTFKETAPSYRCKVAQMKAWNSSLIFSSSVISTLICHRWLFNGACFAEHKRTNMFYQILAAILIISLKGLFSQQLHLIIFTHSGFALYWTNWV